jgi:adenine-specific DNA glycosylase
MTVSAAELLGWYDVARRDLPWREPGVIAWQILVSEFMLQQNSGVAGAADLAGLRGTLAHADSR